MSGWHFCWDFFLLPLYLSCLLGFSQTWRKSYNFKLARKYLQITHFLWSYFTFDMESFSEWVLTRFLLKENKIKKHKTFLYIINLNHKYPKSDGNYYFSANVLPIFFTADISCLTLMNI